MIRIIRLFANCHVLAAKAPRAVTSPTAAAPTKEWWCKGDPGCWSPRRLPAEILPRPEPHRAGLHQVQNSAAKGGSAKLRGDLRRLRQNPRQVLPGRMRRIHQERRICVDLKAGYSR